MIRMALTRLRTNSLQEAKIPEPRGGQLLIRVCSSSVCGADMALYEGLIDVDYPLVMGHDFSGTVEAVGNDVKTFKPGDRIGVDPQLSCGKCYFCRRGRNRFCADYSYMGKGVSGAYQQYVLVEERFVHALPAESLF